MKQKVFDKKFCHYLQMPRSSSNHKTSYRTRKIDSRTHLTQDLLSKENKIDCEHCNKPISVEQILLKCPNMTMEAKNLKLN